MSLPPAELVSRSVATCGAQPIPPNSSPGSGRQYTSEHDPATPASIDPRYEGLSMHLFDVLVPGAGAFASFLRDRLSDEDRAAVVAIDDVEAWAAEEAARDTPRFRRLRAAAWDALFS